jgi:hypothetical protein
MRGSRELSRHRRMSGKVRPTWKGMPSVVNCCSHITIAANHKSPIISRTRSRRSALEPERKASISADLGIQLPGSCLRVGVSCLMSWVRLGTVCEGTDLAMSLAQANKSPEPSQCASMLFSASSQPLAHRWRPRFRRFSL